MGSRLKLAAQALALLLVAALLGLLGWKVTHQGGGGELLADVAEGNKPDAPDFRLARLDDDGQLELGSLRGSVVVLNFWATWCDPCKREAPKLQRAWERYRDRGVVFVGVDSNDFDGEARRAMRRYRITYPNVYDGSGSTLERYGGIPLPKTFVLDKRGRIVAYHSGELDDADIERLLDGALSQA